LLCNMTVTLLWKCNELIVTQQELLRYYSNATTDLTCHIMHKTKYIEVTKRPTTTRMLRVDDQEFERVRDIKYLGSIITDDNNTSTETKQRIIMANRASYGLKKQLSSRYLGRQTKCILYKTLMRPILTYCSES
jgi:hypothetical protein